MVHERAPFLQFCSYVRSGPLAHISCVFAVAAKLKDLMMHPVGRPRKQFDLCLVEALERTYATA